MHLVTRLILFLTVLPFAFCLNQTGKVPHNGTALYKPLFALHSNSTPRFHNVSGVTVNPLIKALLGSNSTGSLQKRDELPVGTCAPGTPCVNGACCSNEFAAIPLTSAIAVSVSQTATQKQSVVNTVWKETTLAPSTFAVLNSDFVAPRMTFVLTDANKVTEAVVLHMNPPAAVSVQAEPSDIMKDGILYRYSSCPGGKLMENRASKRSCDTRLPSDLEVTGLTHINFAFANFHPTTFQITPMDPDDLKLYPQFTALKKKKSSLRTWISVGGWSFNDATNTPNTQTAFSDMASSAANRKIFIDSLLQFMKTWAFDGVDLDWEYPGAPDRGGINADTKNFVALLRDMKETFGNLYGVSVTLPASYWYLRWFDIKAMEEYLDFFNVMTYDIHGVWDSTNKFTGPYVRPHTNLTEIRQGLDLLWRNNINPGNVNLGLGWYGRSFTLADPSCKTPGCIFSSGGSPGECTKSSGTLSNAEVFRIIQQKGLSPQMDREAGVKWVSWDDQWVSYDDGETMALKMEAANRWCLGGKLVWAIDLDDSAHTSSFDLLGMGTSNGVSPEIAKQIKDVQLEAEIDATVRNSCYWSFCGEGCVPGYFPETTAKGQVLGISRDTVCTGDSYQTLCCAPSTNTGTCSWEGWRGVGLSCSSRGCSDPSASLVAMNTNQYVVNQDINNNLTCNGGSQSYCCTGFSPSPKFTTNDLALVGQNGLTKRGVGSGKDPRCIAAVSVGAAVLAGLLAFVSFGLSFAAGAGVAAIGSAACPTTGSGSAAGGAVGVIPLVGVGPKGPKGGKPTTTVKSTVTGKPSATGKQYGQWGTKATYGKNDNDCSVTYTCRYGKGWDEICDNQRWAIDKKLGGRTVYHIDVRAGDSTKDDWESWRVKEYHTLARQKVNRQARCQVDEFPMGVLWEAKSPNPQAVRLVNGPANGRQGGDFSLWKVASWAPCSALRSSRGKPPPPVTFEFGDFVAGDDRINAANNGQHFIQKYGFDSQTQNSLCWATFTHYVTNSNNKRVLATSTVSDHGFRALPDDPMFNNPYRWPRNRYDWDPEYLRPLPTDIASISWLKRSNAESALAGKLAVEFADAEFEIVPLEDPYCAKGDDECADWVSYLDTPPPPEPTHVESPAETGIDGTSSVRSAATAAEKATQALVVLPSMPLETGRAEVHIEKARHMLEHKKRHRFF